MKTTVIQTRSIISNPTMIVGGYMILNPTRGIYSAGSEISVINKTENENCNVYIKTYDGHICDGANLRNVPLSPISEEVLDDGTIVRTYKKPTIYDFAIFTVDGVTKTFRAYPVHLCETTGDVKTPYRIDIIRNDSDIDVTIAGAANNNYGNSCYLTAEQLYPGDFAETGKIFHIKHTQGKIDMNWFKGNESIYQFGVSGRSQVSGSIMNLVDSWATLCEVNLYSYSNYMVGVTGDMTEFLDALKAKGTRNRTIHFNIGTTSITHTFVDVNNFTISFDANGDWTVV